MEMLTYILLLLVVSIVYLLTSRRRSAALQRIPGPLGYPLVGHLHMVRALWRETSQTVLKLAEQYGPVFQISLFGHVNVFLLDPNDVEVLLSGKSYIPKGIHYKLLHRWLGTGLLTSKGEKWKNHRRILTPAFHFKIIESYVPIFNKHSNILGKKLEALKNAKYIEINKLVDLCTLDVICETAMGVVVNAQHEEHNEYVRAVKRMGEIFKYRLLSPWLFNSWMHSLSKAYEEEVKVVKCLHSFTESLIKQRKASRKLEDANAANDEDPTSRTKKYRTFLDTLLEVSEESGLSDTDIREEVDTFMFEGHDTTSAAICWALFLLGGHQDIQDKAVEELKEIFGHSHRDPDYNDLQNMKYLERVIKEALRLYPSVPMYSRILKTDLRLKNYLIPSQANVVVYPYIMHRNPNIYPEPEVFNPDRFLLEQTQKRHPFAYVPFSAGPRNCIGQKFALLEEKAVLSRILRRFRVTSLDKKEDFRVLVEMILKPEHSLRIRLEPRD